MTDKDNQMSEMLELKPCGECGMLVSAAEYHPFAACLMFKSCHDGDVVRSNLSAVVSRAEQAKDAEIADLKEAIENDDCNLVRILRGDIKEMDAEIAKLKAERNLLARYINWTDNYDTYHQFASEALDLARKIVRGE